MRRRHNQYLVRYNENPEVIETWKSHTVIGYSLDDVHKKMAVHSPGCEVEVIYELKQVWGKG